MGDMQFSGSHVQVSIRCQSCKMCCVSLGCYALWWRTTQENAVRWCYNSRFSPVARKLDAAGSQHELLPVICVEFLRVNFR